MKLLFVLLFSNLSWGAYNCPVDSADKHPSVVKIFYKQIFQGRMDDFYCTGTIVKKCYVLTAAHCLYGGKSLDKRLPASDFSVRGGPHSEKDFGAVLETIPHPEFKKSDEKLSKLDVGVLRLAKCSELDTELNRDPLTVGEVTVGGYGSLDPGFAFKLQKDRHMGSNSISKFDEDQICLRETRVAETPTRVLDSQDCIPAGQDSGSSVFRNGKIIGVFFSSREEGIRGENPHLRVYDQCAVNLLNPKVRKFLDDVLNSPAAPAPHSEAPITTK